MYTAMFFPPAAGNLHQQPLRVANVCNNSSRRLFILDRATKQSILFGSDLCVFPCKLLSGRKTRVNYCLFAAIGTTIPT